MTEGAELDGLGVRERLFASLTEEEATLVFRHDASVAGVRVASGVEIVLAALPAGGSIAELQPMIDALVREKTIGLLHVVVVGGSAAEVAPVLERAAPPWRLRRRFGFDHVDATGA